MQTLPNYFGLLFNIAVLYIVYSSVFECILGLIFMVNIELQLVGWLVQFVFFLDLFEFDCRLSLLVQIISKAT